MRNYTIRRFDQGEATMTIKGFDRREIIEKIKSIDNSHFQSEMEHFLNVDDREYKYDELTALFDLEDSIKYHWDKNPKNKSLLDLVRTIMIEIGYYRKMTIDEISSTFCSNGRSPWDFKLNTIPYTSDYPAEEWMFPNE